MPKVSIIIPTYNRAEYILESLESIFEQTYSDYEIIVIDDGSIDSTREVLQPLANAGKLCYVYQRNQGESAARNHAMLLAQGQYFAFLDSDDLFLPSKLEKQVVYLDTHPEVAFVHSSFSRFNHAGTDLGYLDTSHLTGWVYPDILLDWSVLIPPSTVMVRAKVIDKIGGFLEGMRWGPDQDLWRRITSQYPIGVIPETLTKMRFHGGSVSSDKAASVSSFERYLQKAFDDDPELDERFRRRVYAKFYSNLGHNILASGSREQMVLVRVYSRKAICQVPWQWSAYFGWLGSLLSFPIRNWLLGCWRKVRYHR